MLQSYPPKIIMDSGNSCCYQLYFNKDCFCGKTINEHLLPNSIQKPNLTSSFTACVDCLIYANTRFESTEFIKILIRSVGEYSKIIIKNQSHLRELLKKLCDAYGMCPNFIKGEQISECSHCDDVYDESGAPLKNKVFFLSIRCWSLYWKQVITIV